MLTYYMQILYSTFYIYTLIFFYNELQLVSSCVNYLSKSQLYYILRTVIAPIKHHIDIYVS